jgi:hypothetical protein
MLSTVMRGKLRNDFAHSIDRSGRSVVPARYSYDPAVETNRIVEDLAFSE